MEEYIYAALTLHASGIKINEENVKKVLQATGKTPDETRIKNLIASLEGINIDEALKKAVVTASAAPVGAPAEKKEEKKPEEEKKTEEEAAGGLASLFG